MSSRVLSAYFDDFRRGRRQREELRRFMEEAIRHEPLRRGHFLSWLDQAQYEHPIPVTEFLLLRKEIEARLNQNDPPHAKSASPRPDDSTPDDSTPGDSTPGDSTPGDSTPGDATLIADIPEDATLVTPRGDEDTTDLSHGSGPSDGVHLHGARVHGATDQGAETLVGAVDAAARDDAAGPEAATLMGAPDPQGTIITDVHASPPAEPAPVGPGARFARGFPGWLWLGAALLLAAVVLGYWALRPLATPVQPPVATPAVQPGLESTSPDVVGSAVGSDNAPVTEAGAAVDAANPAAVNAEPVEAISATNVAPDAPPLELTDELDPQQALGLLQQRIAAGRLLPADDPANAEAVLEFLRRQHGDSPEFNSGRRLLKAAYLEASQAARETGDWDQSQRLLDAAFQVVRPTTAP